MPFLFLLIALLASSPQAHAMDKVICSDALESVTVAIQPYSASLFESIIRNPEATLLDAEKVLMALTQTPFAVPNVVRLLAEIKNRFSLSSMSLGDIPYILEQQIQKSRPASLYADPQFGELLLAIVSSEDSMLYTLKEVAALMRAAPLAERVDGRTVAS